MADAYSVDAAGEALEGGFPMTTGRNLIDLIEAFPGFAKTLADGLTGLGADVDELGGPMLTRTTEHVKNMAVHAQALQADAESAAEAIAVESQFWVSDE
jgi:hypothetical protein